MKKGIDDLYIAILKFGKDKLEEGVTYDDLKEFVDQNYSITDQRLKQIFCELYESRSPQDPQGWNHLDVKIPMVLRVESKFRLLEHEELQHANRSSRNATYWAAGAMFLSICATVVSIFYSEKQLNAPTKIEPTEFKLDNDQLKQILEQHKDSSQCVQVKTDTLKN